MNLDLTGVGAGLKQDRRYMLLKDSNVIYVEYESGYAEFVASGTKAEETEAEDARMLSEDSKDVCGLYLKAGAPTYQLEVKPGGRLNRNQLTFMLKKSLKENVGEEPIRYCELLEDFRHKDVGSYNTDSKTNGIIYRTE